MSFTAATRMFALLALFAGVASVVGGAISAYHYVLQWFPQLGAGSCDRAAPCAVFYVREFGFVSIPFMVLLAFLAIVTGLALPDRHASVPEGASNRDHLT